MFRPDKVFFIAVLFYAALFLSPAYSMEVKYFGEVGCAHCDDFTDKTVPELENRYDIKINVTVKDILSTEGYEECRSLLESLGYVFKYFPVVVIGNNIYQGATDISTNLAGEAEFFAAHSGYLPERKREEIPADFLMSGVSAGGTGSGSAGFAEGSLSVLTVLAAGLADGINPCAFTVLLFFFSYLSLRQKSRSRFLAAGAVFISSVFVTYLLIGFGLYSMLGTLTSYIQSARIVIKAAAAAAAVIFALLSLRDYYTASGKASEKAEGAGKTSKGGEASPAILLKLPDALNRKIHSVIRKNLNTQGMLIMVFATGFIVSVLELACTGQVYLPTIAYILQKDSLSQGIFLLVLYNTGFVFPMLIIYGLLAFGMNLNPVIEYFKSRIAAAKLVLAFVFILLAAAIWFL